MESPLVSIPPHARRHASFLRRIKRSTKRPPTPQPPKLVPRQIITTAVTAAKLVTKQDHSPPKLPLLPPPPSIQSPSIQSPSIQSSADLQLEEWQHYAEFETSISMRVL